MNYQSVINTCTDYIRNHPSEEICAQDLSRLCGYSLYHLSSVFRICMGCSIGRYILEEKLRIAAREILQGRKISYAAADIGFDTGAGFNKAFRKQFGTSPSHYKKSAKKTGLSPRDGSTLLHHDTSSLSQTSLLPEFVKRTGFKVYGYRIAVDEDHVQAGSQAFWSQINFKEFPSYPENVSDYAEVSLWLDPDRECGRMDYFFGYVTSDPRPGEGFERIVLGEGTYAVFRIEYGETEVQMLPERMRQLWEYVFEEWVQGLDKVGLDGDRLCFELYRRELAELWIPVTGV